MRWQLVALWMACAVVAFTSAQGYGNYYDNSGYYPRYNNYYGNSGYGGNYGYYNNGYGNNGYNYNGYNNGYYNNYYSQQRPDLLSSLFSLFGSSSGSSGCHWVYRSYICS